MNRLIVIFVAFFIALLWGTLFVLPKNEDLNSLKKEIQEKRTELQSKETYLANLKELTEKFKNYETQLSKIDSALPESPELPALFNFLQKSASQSGLVLKGVDVALAFPGEKKKTEKETGIQETYLNLQLSGSYLSFKEFLPVLEKSARLIEVESINFSSPQEEQMDFRVKIRVNSL